MPDQDNRASSQSDDEFAGMIAAQIQAGRKAEAMRLFWERYSIGLREAKNLVDAWERGVRVLPTAPRKR